MMKSVTRKLAALARESAEGAGNATPIFMKAGAAALFKKSPPSRWEKLGVASRRLNGIVSRSTVSNY